MYAIARQASGVSQGIVAAKSRLSKRGLTIPRLELVAGHMAVNLVDNLRRALQGFPVVSMYCWLDITVALHWICGRGEYRQFVQNRIRKIQKSQDRRLEARSHGRESRRLGKSRWVRRRLKVVVEWSRVAVES